jgi:hypothetical protein
VSYTPCINMQITRSCLYRFQSLRY